MTTLKSILAVATFAAALLPAAAEAQYASAQPAPLYPYATTGSQPYAVEVSPGTYVIHRPSRNYPYVRCVNGCDGSAPAPARRRAAHAVERRVTHNDPALIEQLRRRQGQRTKGEVINTTRIVREKPVVIEHRRVVDDPPRVIERRHYVDDAPQARPSRKRVATIESEVATPAPGPAKRGKTEPRVIRAEAEVTILGPDRMSIRLFRKRRPGAEAKAEAD